MRIPREQLQRLAAGAFGGVLAAAAFVVFALQPMWGRMGELDRQIAAQDRVEQDLTRLMQGAEGTARRYEATRSALLDIMNRQMPPDGNPMAWATEVMRQAAGTAGIAEENRQLSEISSGSVPASGLSSRVTKAPLLSLYEVRIDLLCGYHRLGFVLASLERQLPYMALRRLSVQPGTDSATLRVSMNCSFPRFTREGFPPESRPDAEQPEVKRVRGTGPAEGVNRP
jgi:hypothetical protein